MWYLPMARSLLPADIQSRCRERLLESGIYPGFTKATLNNQGYVLIDNEDDLEKKWAMILSFRPDFNKAMLSFSEEFEKRKDDPSFFGRKGLDPHILTKLVAKAHSYELRVSVHVDTAADFHNAVAGADEIAHLPGYSLASNISLEDARQAAEKGIVVVTTVFVAEHCGTPGGARPKPPREFDQSGKARPLG